MSRIDLASDEDRRYNIDKWARLFKAKTWEELKMLASEDNAIQEAVKTVYQVSEDERQRFIAFGREDAIRRQNGIMKRMDRLQEELLTTQEQLSTTRGELSSMQDALSTTRGELSSTQDALFTTQDELSTTRDALFTAQDELTSTRDALAEKDRIIEQLRAQLSDKES